MKIGGHYEISSIGLSAWRQLAKDCALEEDRVLDLVTAMAAALPDHANDACKKALEEGLQRNVIEPLTSMFIAHAQKLRSVVTTVIYPR